VADRQGVTTNMVRNYHGALNIHTHLLLNAVGLSIHQHISFGGFGMRRTALFIAARDVQFAWGALCIKRTGINRRDLTRKHFFQYSNELPQVAWNRHCLFFLK